MSNKKNWTGQVIKGTNIPWTDIWSSYNVTLEEVDPNIVYELSLEYYGIWKGFGSGCKLKLVDRDPTHVYVKKCSTDLEPKRVCYDVFLCDADEIIYKMDHGKLPTLKYVLTKRGKDYGIKLYKE